MRSALKPAPTERYKRTPEDACKTVSSCVKIELGPGNAFLQRRLCPNNDATGLSIWAAQIS